MYYFIVQVYFTSSMLYQYISTCLNLVISTSLYIIQKEKQIKTSSTLQKHWWVCHHPTLAMAYDLTEFGRAYGDVMTWKCGLHHCADYPLKKLTLSKFGCFNCNACEVNICMVNGERFWKMFDKVLWDIITPKMLKIVNKLLLLITWHHYIVSRHKTPILAVISYANQVSYQQLILG